MIEPLAIAHLLDLSHSHQDLCPARAEDEFYRSFRRFRLEVLVTWLLSLRTTKKGRDMRDPLICRPEEKPIRRRVACGPGSQPRIHQCGTA